MASRVVLGSIALSASHVLSVRQRASVDISSVSRAVAEISTLIQEQQGSTEVEKLIQQIAATPGANGDYKSSLQNAIAAIEGDVEPKILASHKETQRKLNEALSAFKSQEGAANEAFDNAKSADETYFNCVTTEQKLRGVVESKTASHSEANTAKLEACQYNSVFRFSSAKDQFEIDCDLGEAEKCLNQMARLKAAATQMETDASGKMGTSQQEYARLKGICDQKTAEELAARNALSSAEKAWSGKRGECAQMVGGRHASMCTFGTELVKKCQLEDTFSSLDAASHEEGHQMSENDRVMEWKSAGTTKCVLQKYMEKGLDGTVSNDDLNACNTSGDEMKLSREDAAVQQLKESIRCVDGPITFATGEAWRVPEGEAPASSSYSSEAFKPAFVRGLARGFAFCE